MGYWVCGIKGSRVYGMRGSGAFTGGRVYGKTGFRVFMGLKGVRNERV